MTTKQAADIIRMLLGSLKGEIEPPKQETIEEAKAFEQQGYECLEMAIKALEQQPCEDAVNRQAVHDLIAELLSDYLHDEDREKIEKLDVKIEDLEAVTPKEKTGHWIDDADKIDAQFGRHTYKCSECGKYAEYFVSGTEVWWDRIKPNFCPNCGARMVSE